MRRNPGAGTECAAPEPGDTTVSRSAVAVDYLWGKAGLRAMAPEGRGAVSTCGSAGWARPAPTNPQTAYTAGRPIGTRNMAHCPRTFGA